MASIPIQAAGGQARLPCFADGFSRSSWSQTSTDTPGTTTAAASLTSPAETKPQDLITPQPQLPVALIGRSGDDLGDGGRRSSPSVLETAPDQPQAPALQVEDISASQPKAEIATEEGVEHTTLTKRGERKVASQKYIMTASLIAWWPKYYYIYLPFISFPLVLNCCMIASIAFFTLLHAMRPEKVIEPDYLESLVYVIPYYNEICEECVRSLDSLVNQTGVENHKKGIMAICDGRVRGPGMAKTTADYLNEDIFLQQTQRKKTMGAYTAWDGQQMDIEVSKGVYKGTPFYCIVKEQNQGKRDSLIVIRSFLYKFNLANDVKVGSVDHLVGMDADTVFEDKCISELLKESKYPNTVGVCGYVAVDFKDGNWNLWSIYQSAEYTIAQGLRRLHQSIATKKVSRLPGCCQLLKICEEACGDLVLVDLFGYHPQPMDGMIKRIRATASEDRNHICQLLVTFPQAQTRQALRARAQTDVPHSNDLLLFTSRNCQWWERIVAFSNVLTWSLKVFVIASIGCMIVAFISQPWWLILAFAGVMVIPLVYYVVMATWLPRNLLERAQFLLDLFVFTRQVLEEDLDEKTKGNESPSSEDEDSNHQKERYAVTAA
ncbi:hypothetical protein B0T10DRAFT_527822 [Thelonectria olida]|uniref:Chitin synthase n=1 Tax=Thelonectria olida TaxID=1576542 RepID=A0A9P8W8X6_9HYPO|nr:hypothetical protein B0T10DRAFT_527822 [Thelonectria olida]